jgi:hypothetical protein
VLKESDFFGRPYVANRELDLASRGEEMLRLLVKRLLQKAEAPKGTARDGFTRSSASRALMATGVVFPSPNAKSKYREVDKMARLSATAIAYTGCQLYG